MYRKVLIATLMLGISMVGFSKKEEIKNVNPKELAKTVVENSQKELLDNIGLRLEDGKRKLNVKLGKCSPGQQFLYQEDLIVPVLKGKSYILKDVFNKLCEDSNRPTTFVYKTKEIKIRDIDYETSKKQGKVDSTTLIVPVSFEAHTIAKEGVSDVKYDVTFTWRVKVKQETEKTVVDGKKKNVIVYVKKQEPTLISSVTTPIKYLTSDRESMKAAAQKVIVKWYENLPQTLDKQYVKQIVTAIEPMSVSSDEIRVSPLPQSQRFTVTDVPTVKIGIDPYGLISNDEKPLYTNPTAYKIIAPTFNVSVDNTFKHAEISVSYEVKTVKPIPDSVKVLRRSAADTVIAELDKQLSAYVASRGADQKTVIKDLFCAAESNVGVSYLPKRGAEIIKTKAVQRYLSLLRGASLNLSPVNFEVVDPSWDTLIYTVEQKYQSKTYSDCTQKKIYLTYDSEKGRYLINKIEVVPNSTKVE